MPGRKAEDPYIDKLDEAVKKAKLNRNREYMTLYMRDLENIEQGIEQGIEQMVVNALTTTKSVHQTAVTLRLDEQFVRKTAEAEKYL